MTSATSAHKGVAAFPALLLMVVLLAVPAQSRYEGLLASNHDVRLKTVV